MKCLPPLAAAALFGSAAASIAQDAAPAPPPSPRPLQLNRFVPTGEKRTVNFVTALFPDCSSRGPVVARLVAPPEHGRLDFAQGDSFPSYTPNSPLAHCNGRKSPGLMVQYESEAGYTGEDGATIFLIFPDGSGAEWRYLFIVK